MTGFGLIILAIFMWFYNKALSNIYERTVLKPHIVFILADDYGFNDIGYHGSLIQTPNLDRLAAEGTKLENYYVQPICSPTRSQLMSGRYQIRYGQQHRLIFSGQPYCFPVNEITLPQKLQESGYKTHMVGKWHLGFFKEECLPLRRGFDTFFGYLNGMGDYWTHHRPGSSPDMPEETKHWLGFDFWDGDRPAYEYIGNYSALVFGDRAKKVIEKHDKTKPMFLYIPFQSVHKPYQAPKKYVTLYENMTDDEDRRIYAGMVTCMDDVIGDIVESLKQNGMWENTVLVFSSDNGGIFAGNNWPLRGEKLTLWEGGVRANGFITGPVIPENIRNTTYTGLMHVTDWFPTFVEGVAKGKTEGLSLDGVNHWNSLQSNGTSPRSEILHNIDAFASSDVPMGLSEDLMYDTDMKYPQKYNSTMRAAIRVGDWKLLTDDPGNGNWTAPPESNATNITSIDHTEEEPIWLFNIAEDPYEMNDVAQENPEIVQKLLKKLSDYYDESVPIIYPRPELESNPALNHGMWKPWK